MAGKIATCYTTDGYIYEQEYSRSPRDSEILRSINNTNMDKTGHYRPVNRVVIEGKTGYKEYKADLVGNYFYFFTTKKERDAYYRKINKK